MNPAAPNQALSVNDVYIHSKEINIHFNPICDFLYVWYNFLITPKQPFKWCIILGMVTAVHDV